jgi:hypothetical protein
LWQQQQQQQQQQQEEDKDGVRSMNNREPQLALLGVLLDGDAGLVLLGCVKGEQRRVIFRHMQKSPGNFCTCCAAASRENNAKS